jgi:hypothetical protein
MQKPLYFDIQGQFIAGTLHLPEGEGPWPGVIFCHGFSGDKVESHFIFVETARALERRGIASLRFDFRGSGESDGEFVDMTPGSEIADARRALDVLAEQPETDAARLAVLGLSLGGLVAACAAARDGAVSGLVLWSAVADLAEVFEERHESAPERKALQRQGYYDYGAHRIGEGFVESVRRVDPLEELASWGGPALLVHGSEDGSVPVEHAGRYERALSGETTVHIIEGADHTYAGVAWEREAIEVTRDWLVERML